MSTSEAMPVDTDLRLKSAQLRIKLLELIYNAGAGHTGGSLSSLDILNVLYNRVLRIRPDRPEDPARDRYVQSKGHCVEALYVVLADAGFFPESDLSSLCKYKSRYIGHPTRKIPGIEQNTGALGHGLSVACGLALAAQKDGLEHRVFTLLGDGELAEGSNWESCMFAAHYGLDNLVAILDHNSLQITGPTREVMSLEPLADKWRCFGWDVEEINGHDLEGLTALLSKRREGSGKPLFVLANTVKGKGISYMENEPKWHHGVPKDEEFKQGMDELKAALEALGKGN